MNPASRLNEIVQHFHSANPSTSIKEAWDAYMGSTATPMSEEELLDVIQAVLAEIRAMEARLKELAIPSHLYADCIRQLRIAFSPTQHAGSWSNHREQIIKRATPLSLQWTAWALSQFDEDDIAAESIEALKSALVEQETLLQESNLPAGLREMLERQTAALRRALHLYKIQGVAPLRKAVSDSVGEMKTAPAELVATVESAAPEAKNALKRGMTLIGKAAEVADKGSKTIKFGKELYELGTSAWTTVQGLLT